jgi:uncharacterized membrane protein
MKFKMTPAQVTGFLILVIGALATLYVCRNSAVEIRVAVITIVVSAAALALAYDKPDGASPVDYALFVAAIGLTFFTVSSLSEPVFAFVSKLAN